MIPLADGYDGYTLLEVMVALIIIGISITAVTGGLSGAKRLSVKADHSIQAARILNNLRSNPFFINRVLEDEAVDGGIEEEAGWHCKATAEPLVVNLSDMQIPENQSEQEGDGFSRNRQGDGWETNAGEEIEVPGMKEITLCISDQSDIIDKSYCLTFWKRSPETKKSN